MKWFKHMTGASDDEFIVALEDKYGLEGYARWFKLLEACAKDGSPDNDYTLTYPIKKWCEILKIRRPLLTRYLADIQLLGRIYAVTTTQQLTITICNLSKIKDNHSRNLQAKKKNKKIE